MDDLRTMASHARALARGVLLATATGACAVAPAPAPAQGAPPTVAKDAAARLSAADLHADVATLRRTFEALHPGLRRYNTPAQIDAAFTALDASFHDGATLAAAFRAFSLFAAKIRCGHTFLNPTNQTEAVRRTLFGGPHLPVHFRWLQGHLIVTESFAPDAALVPGTEIAAIDGTPAPEILARLLTVARADGSNDHKRVASMERRGFDRYEPFDVAFPLFFPGAGDPFVLDVIDPGGARRRVSVSGRRGDTGEGRSSSRGADTALWSLRFLDDRTGYLAMPTWVTYDTKWDWKADLERAFAELDARRATALIVDLRGNEGGNDVGDRILGHYLDAPLHVEGLERWTRYRRVPDELREPLHTWDKSFFDWGEAAKPLGDGFFRLVRYDDDPSGDVLSPLSPRAASKLIVLVDGANSSATFQFAQVVQRHHLGTLVGEPTGGNQRGINGGAFFFVQLPRSGLELDLPLIGRFRAAGPPDALPDAGLTPDVEVRPTSADIAAGRDPALITARRVAGR